MNAQDQMVNSETSAAAAAAAIEAMATATGLSINVTASLPVDSSDPELTSAMLLSGTGPTGSVVMAFSEGAAEAIVAAADASDAGAQAAWDELTRVGLDASHTFVASLSAAGQLIGPVTTANPIDRLPVDAGELSGIRVNVEVGGTPGSVWWLLPLPSDEGIDVSPVAYPELGGGVAQSVSAEIALLSDVSMDVTVELGRTVMRVRDVLDLSEGSVVELDRPIGAHVDVLVNGSQVARGEVVVIDDVLGVRITGVSTEAKRPM